MREQGSLKGEGMHRGNLFVHNSEQNLAGNLNEGYPKEKSQKENSSKSYEHLLLQFVHLHVLARISILHTSIPIIELV